MKKLLGWKFGWVILCGGCVYAASCNKALESHAQAPSITLTQSQSVPTMRYQNREVQTDGGIPIISGNFGQPAIRLWEAIQQDKTAARSRASWSYSLGVFDVGTVLYDRQNHILKYYDMGGETDSDFKPNSWEEHFKVLNVTDEALQKLAQNIEAKTARSIKYSSCFRYLQDDGYTIQELK